MEYDFIVAPGADPGVIRLAFEGQIDDNGDLILHTEGGEIRLHKPRIYQEIDGIKQPVPGGYVLLEPETQNSKPETQQVGFQRKAQLAHE